MEYININYPSLNPNPVPLAPSLNPVPVPFCCCATCSLGTPALAYMAVRSSLTGNAPSQTLRVLSATFWWQPALQREVWMFVSWCLWSIMMCRTIMRIMCTGGLVLKAQVDVACCYDGICDTYIQ